MGFLSGSASSESEERILLSSMWTGLGGAQNEGLHKEVIRAFLLAVEGVKITDSVQSPTEEEFGLMKDGEFYPDCSKISKHFKLMYLNKIRHAREGTKRKNIKAENEARQDCTFQPILTDNTQQLALKYRQKIADNYDGGKISVLDILTAQTNKEQWIEETKKELENKEQEECTFHPITNENIQISPDESIQTTGDKCMDLYQLARTKDQNREGKTKEEYEFEKNVSECTFQPNTEKSFKKAETKQHFVNQRSIQDNLDRMKRAREEREFKKSMTTRGFGNPLPNKKPTKKVVNKRPTNYIRPQIKKVPKSTSVATTGKMTKPKKEPVKSYAQRNAKNRRTINERNRLNQQTQSSKRKINSKTTSNKEVRAIEHTKYSANIEELPIDTDKMYRKIEQEEQEIHEKISQDPEEYPQESQDYSPEEEKNQYPIDDSPEQLSGEEPIGQYVEEPVEYNQEQDQDQENLPEGEDYQPDYEGQEEENEGEGNPLLFVDVNLGPGRAERIVVYEGDTADELADEFTKKHGLDESLKEKLVKLLESQIAGLLGTIIEDVEGVSNETG